MGAGTCAGIVAPFACAGSASPAVVARGVCVVPGAGGGGLVGGDFFLFARGDFGDGGGADSFYGGTRLGTSGAVGIEKAGVVRDFTGLAKRLAANAVASLVPDRIQGQELYAR